MYTDYINGIYFSSSAMSGSAENTTIRNNSELGYIKRVVVLIFMEKLTTGMTGEMQFY
jgi:hypothetical protein